MPTENRSSSNPGARTFTIDSLVAALEQVQALHEISADLIAERIFGQPAEQHQGEQATCSHEWTDDGEWLLICTKCGAQENHEPYGWVQTRGPAINQFTQEWDIVQEWEGQGFQYKAMHDHPAPADAGEFEQLRAQLFLCMEALSTCKETSGRDVDGDHVTRQHFDSEKVSAALERKS